MTAVLASIKVVFLTLTMLTPAGLPASPTRMILQPDLPTCLAQQQSAVNQAELSGLAHWSVGCTQMVTGAGGGIMDTPQSVPSVPEDENSGE